MKWKNALVVGLVVAVVLAVGLELSMEQAKRSRRTKRHGAGEVLKRVGGCLWLGPGPGQEALQGGAGEDLDT